MTEAQVLALIQQWIVTNGNNEITANVLRPILEAMLAQPNDVTGDLDDLDTSDKTNLVAAINEVLGAIGENTVAILTGATDPNDTPPPSYSIGDLYIWNDGSHQGLFIYNGFFWFEFSQYLSTGGYSGTAQDLKDEIDNINNSIFDGDRTDSAAFNITKPKTIYFGTDPAVGTLEAGSASTIWKDYFVKNDGTALLTINDSGASTVANLTPGSSKTFMWDGVNVITI